MTSLDIVRQRLSNQHLLEPVLGKPSDVVGLLGAVQAQDYSAAKWGVGQRTRNAVDSDVEGEFAAGRILRTHLLRPTWHFVTPADIRWMLKLTATRVHAMNAFSYRKLELDDAVSRRSHAALRKTLQGGKQLTRNELAAVLARNGIDTKNPQRLAYLMMRAELDGVVCSGARRHKQFTYALLDERAPHTKTLERDEALFELTRRYFATRGPATSRDFSWWSGLTMADSKKAIQIAESELEHESVAGQTYWFARSALPPTRASPMAHLLPNYDEYFIGFRDRSAIGQVVKKISVEARSNTFSAHVVAMDGQLVGGWRRTLKKNAVVVELNLLTRLTAAEQRAIAAAAEKYAAFLELTVELATSSARPAGVARRAPAEPKRSAVN